MEIDARCQNHDSYAILHTANIFNRDYLDYDRKILFVISDGEPAGSGYGGLPARKHMLNVSQACSKKGIEVYGVGIDNAFTNAAGAAMYGDNKFVVLSDVRSSLGIMSRFIRQIAMK
jgi:nitric oxide reductase activation protein